ncbi:MAG: hypothetical protein RIE06_28420 [Roseibium album]|uniref:hypothetical protein n=1 Tax=Roseibium album TaxID=311410 RepID=UPI0032ED4C34
MTLIFEGLFRFHIACMSQSANPGSGNRICRAKKIEGLWQKKKSPQMKWAAFHLRRSGTSR